jgi:hypothetical protein
LILWLVAGSFVGYWTTPCRQVPSQLGSRNHGGVSEIDVFPPSVTHSVQPAFDTCGHGAHCSGRHIGASSKELWRLETERARSRLKTAWRRSSRHGAQSKRAGLTVNTCCHPGNPKSRKSTTRSDGRVYRVPNGYKGDRLMPCPVCGTPWSFEIGRLPCVQGPSEDSIQIRLFMRECGAFQL